MKFVLLDYVKESGWSSIPRAEQEHWLGIYRQYMQAMADAGVLKSSSGLYPSSEAKSVRVSGKKPQVLDGPFTETKEQLGGFHIIEVPGLDTALAWAAKSPTALHGTVEVRQVREGTLLTREMAEVLNP